MRVLAVGEVGDLLVGAQDHGREVVELLGEPARDRRVVARRAGERLGGEALARAEREVAVEVGELLEDRVVALGLDHDGGEREVLRGGPDHRRAADVDVLDHVVVGGAAARRGLLERVEVHAHEVDELDRVVLGRDHVGRVVAAREQAGVELRVQRLDAAAHDLGEAGEVLDRAHREARGLERLRRPAGRHELDVERGQALRELHDARLVRHGEQRTSDANLAWLCHRGRTIVTRRSARAAGWPGRSGPRRGRSAAPPRRAGRARSGAARCAPSRPPSPPAGRAPAAG